MVNDNTVYVKLNFSHENYKKIYYTVKKYDCVINEKLYAWNNEESAFSYQQLGLKILSIT